MTQTGADPAQRGQTPGVISVCGAVCSSPLVLRAELAAGDRARRHFPIAGDFHDRSILPPGYLLA